jgi:7,8-dihydroneopterin aldolase/epimerase/oxygenase
MSDAIEVRDLRVKTRIGVTEEERQSVRPVTIHIEMSADLSAAGASDRLEDTIDYGAVIAEVSSLVAAGEFLLLEHLAHQIVTLIFATYPVAGVTVEVAKEPPVPEDVREVAVRINRERSS